MLKCQNDFAIITHKYPKCKCYGLMYKYIKMNVTPDKYEFFGLFKTLYRLIDCYYRVLLLYIRRLKKLPQTLKF